jgi:hypothetical protein
MKKKYLDQLILTKFNLPELQPLSALLLPCVVQICQRPNPVIPAPFYLADLGFMAPWIHCSTAPWLHGSTGSPHIPLFPVLSNKFSILATFSTMIDHVGT